MSALEPPRYVERSEEQDRIMAEIAKVRETEQSRAVLLYGRGGTGKTRLVRQLPAIDHDPKVVWLDPIDVDDSHHWLMSNLERRIADQLDPERQYFREYFDYVSELPRQSSTSESRQTAPAVSRQAVLDHLNRIKEIFTDCYKSYLDGTGSSVVITFDTIEAIRGMYFLRTLTRWMKALPSTLFILAGRSVPGIGDWADPVRTALEDPPSAMRVTIVPLGEFGELDCRKYLTPISEAAHLSEDDVEKLVHLTQGHPLWLAFAVGYLNESGLPAEMNTPLEKIKIDLPYHADASLSGRDLADSFKRRLVAPYQLTDFWHEAIRRLAVVRESISETIWLELMADTELPDDVTERQETWDKLRAIEWIRPRANDRYVTLHDAVAEELAERVIDLHDTDQRWRHELWKHAATIYADHARALEQELNDRNSAADRELELLESAKIDASAPAVEGREAELIDEIAELDRWQQELNQLKVAHLFYLLLSDFHEGTQQFVGLLHDARRRHDVLFEDLLAFQLQRFLPGGADQATLGDTIGAAINDFRQWLSGDGRDSYVDIGVEMAAYLVDMEQPEPALSLLNHLPPHPDPLRSYRVRNLQGNACMRIPRRVLDAEERFREALAEAGKLEAPDRHRYISDAYKELGYYYRNIGRWKDADEAYQMARNAHWEATSQGSTESDREEIASIYTNWAYLKGIGGEYEDGINLVETAITIRRRIKRPHEQAISWSVKGEVHRYQRHFKEAWESYGQAEELFGDTSWSWRGVICQEQAICLYQSIPLGVQLLPPTKDAAEEAKSLILQSLDLCRVYNARYYPSALNRAGRIFGSTDPDAGLAYLKEAAEKAEELYDGWFWVASIIEYAELCYRTWEKSQNPRYLNLIPDIAIKITQTEEARLGFPELRGRWGVLQGHLAMHEVLGGRTELLDQALENYRTAFPLIMKGWVGSYGESVIPQEFQKFTELVWRLPDEDRLRWQWILYASWSGEGASATKLLARLEELH